MICSKGDKAKASKAAFVCCYAPTEHKTPLAEVLQFYGDIELAITDAKTASGLDAVPVLGDFNVHLGSGLSHHYPNIVGKHEAEREASRNTRQLMGLCNTHKLVAVQTWRPAQVMSRPENWYTWYHRPSKRYHQKDLILLPEADRGKVRVCRPFDPPIETDHRLVLCRFHAKPQKRTWEESNVKSPHMSAKGKLRRLELRVNNESRLRYQNALSLAIADRQPGWKTTERAMQKAALETLSQPQDEKSDTWLTTSAHNEISCCMSEVLRLRRLHRDPSIPTVHPELRRARFKLRNCISKHKGIYRRKLANTAVRCGDAKQEGDALLILAKGHDLSLRQPARAKAPVSPTIFTAHFESLFSKSSDKETLGLTEENAGPKIPPKTELSGPPTLKEVQKAVKGLSRGTAPGSNGLRPELFKLGGEPLARRLVSDFETLWPTEEEVQESAPAPPRAKVLQQWQDADVVTLYKLKGDPTDPTNYRGIFLLDVAGKVLASVINQRLKVLLEESISDAQCGFRQNRSTSHLIHALRRTQEACRRANVKAYAVFVDFAKAFDSPPRAAIWECLEWSGCPPDLLAVIMAIHDDPRGKIQGSIECFRVARGVRQGCVLGPTLFILVLEYCLRLTGTEGIGLRFTCLEKKGIPIPPDLQGLSFSAALALFADDLELFGTDPDGLSRALDRLQAICGSIGLDVSVSKTEWVYLHNPDKAEMAACASLRPNGPCCSKITLNGVAIKHSSQFTYLGSVISEHGGVAAETASRVGKATAALNKTSKIWSSPASIRAKSKLLNSRILPVLEYASECGNHVQADLKLIDGFLSTCRHRILSLPRWRRGWRRQRLDILRRKCPLTTPLGLISPRRLAFFCKLMLRPGCEFARAMLFAEVIPERGLPANGSSSRSSYTKVLDLDAR